jgi:hypothetical protein
MKRSLRFRSIVTFIGLFGSGTSPTVAAALLAVHALSLVVCIGVPLDVAPLCHGNDTPCIEAKDQPTLNFHNPKSCEDYELLVAEHRLNPRKV